MRKEDALELEFVERYRMKNSAMAIHEEMDWSFIIRKIYEESDSMDQLMSRVFKEKNTKIAYYLFKYCDLTRNQEAEIILFLIQKNDSFRLAQIIKDDYISGGILSIAVEKVEDFKSLYFISMYANLKKLDLGQRNTIVDRVLDIADKKQRRKFLRDVRWLSDSHKEKIYNS